MLIKENWLQSKIHFLHLQESAIEEYLKPIDKNAHMIMNMQLDKEEKQMKEMIKAMQEQALHHKEMALRQAELNSVDSSQQTEDTSSPSKKEQASWSYIIIYLKGE